MVRLKSIRRASPALFSFLSPMVAALAFALPTAADVEAAAPAAPAGPPGVIAGKVVHDGVPVASGEAILVDLRRRVSLGADGGFRFEVPPGTYLVEVRASDLPVAVERVTVAAGRETAVEIALHRPVLHDEVFVTAGGGALSQLEVAQPTDVLAGDDLDRRRQATLGETLAVQPGVSSTSFGPGASRPVIRGLGGDRVRMLQDGLGSADASSTSPDHAVAVDPLSAERIEVLRGPATLLYGSSAVGGVVNVLDGRIPDHLPGTALSGSVELLGGSAADERSGAVTLTGGAGRIAWHADVLRRETDDLEIPGHAEVEGAGPEGVLANSALEAGGAGLGLSWIGDSGFAGVAVSGFDTLYGVPGHEHAHEEGAEHEEEHEDEGAVRVDLEQRRVDVAGQWNRGFGVFRGARVRLGVNEYEHRELEGGEVGTRFTNDAWEGRLELLQERRGRLTGSIGVQAGSSDFAAVGEEAFVPPSTTDTLAVFALQNFAITERVNLQVGGRWERQQADPDNEAPDRDLDGFSASVGVVYAPVEGWSVAGSLARATRLPTAAELYADGPHAATGAFEIGDPGFAEETSLGLDLSLRKTTGRVTGVLNLFANRFDDYIFESFTGEEADGLRVIRFRQADAEFVGAELDTLTRLAEFGDDAHLDLRLGADLVRAELTGSGDPLPRIPPVRILAGLEVHRGPLRVGVEARRVDDQDRLGENETPTDGYTLLGASVAYRFVAARTVTEVVLRGSNLTDEEARNHVSFLKDVAPLPGRDVNLMLRVSF